jgi:hypothetical protein
MPQCNSPRLIPNDWLVLFSLDTTFNNALLTGNGNTLIQEKTANKKTKKSPRPQCDTNIQKKLALFF